MISISDIYRFKALIFDLDGTLVDSEPLHIRAWAEITAAYGMPPMTLEYMHRNGGMSTLRIAELYAGAHNMQVDAAALAREKNELYVRTYMEQVPVHRKIAGILTEAAARGLRTAVATGSHLPETEYLLNKYGLRPHVSAIVTSDQVARCKPAPDTYLTAAMRLSTPPRDCLVFEDTPLGLQGVRAAGMTALRVFEGEIVSDFIRP